MTPLPAVGFDALFLEQPMTGAGQYALNLWRQLRDAQQVVAPHLLLPTDAAGLVTAEVGSAATSRAAPPPRIGGGHARKVWWEQAGLVRATRRSRVDLVHVPYFAAPSRQRVPHLVTVHDVIPLALPAYSGSLKMRVYLKLVGRTVRKAPLILTDSHYSKADITRHLGIPAGRIVVTPLAAGPEFHPAHTDAERDAVNDLRERFGLHRPFILNVGGFDLRKRLPHLVRGFAVALPSLPEPHDLVIVGNPHTGNDRLYPPLEPIIQELGIAEHIRLVGFVSHEDKLNLYRAARLFAFVSEYEGFGLNPLEAMACGTPVVCSNRTSLPEIVADAGLSIEPEPDAIARAIVCALSDDDLLADLARRGQRQARHFSWQRTAALTLDAYQRVLQPTAR
jgi:glycosyltransferase involved in cell wall biosynthesis